jgi:hypothetical protein
MDRHAEKIQYMAEDFFGYNPRIGHPSLGLGFIQLN